MCGSTMPGSTTLPRASSTSSAVPRSSPSETMRPAEIPTSAATCPTPGMTSVPRRTIRSSFLLPFAMATSRRQEFVGECLLKWHLVREVKILHHQFLRRFHLFPAHEAELLLRVAGIAQRADNLDLLQRYFFIELGLVFLQDRDRFLRIGEGVGHALHGRLHEVLGHIGLGLDEVLHGADAVGIKIRAVFAIDEGADLVAGLGRLL